MEELDIRKVWEVEQEILDVVDSFCMKNKIRYSLFYGTLLGAVRHKGFIPWDDDIDIMMPRKDYNKFKRIWMSNPPEGFIFQDYHTEKGYPNNFIKIRKDHTTFLQDEAEKSKSFQKGIFIDIFPADRRAPSTLGKVIQYVASAVNLLYSREYTSGSGGIIGLIEKLLLNLPKKVHPVLRDKAEKIMGRWNNRTDTQYYCGCTIRCCKLYYPPETFDKFQMLKFNGKKYPCVKNWDAVLTVNYGDYMKFPPKEERVWKHHPILISLEQNYEEIECK